MGWASGGAVFDPVCRVVVGAADRGDIDSDFATQVLTELIKGLQDRDWDTEYESLYQFEDHEYESLYQFEDHEYVVAAFKAQGVELNDGDGDGEMEEP